MALNNLIPAEVMGALIYTNLRKVRVAADVCNSYAQGLISSYGDSVKIPSVSSVTASAYTKNAAISYGSVDSASVILQLNQQQYFAKNIDMIDENRSIGAVAGIVFSDGVSALKESADQYILQTVMSNGAGVIGGTSARALGTTATPINVSAAASGVLDYVGRVAQRMDEGSVPQEGRWMIVPPWFHNYMVQNKLTDLRGLSNDQVYTNGRVGQIMGYDVRVSANLTNATAAGSHIYAGVANSVEFADDLVNAEMRELETYFGIGVRALYVYGGVVARGDTLVKGVISQS